jgi:hypothetical protein
MIVIVGGVTKNLHYTIAAQLLKQGKAKLPGENKIENEIENNEVESKEVEKIVKKPGRKKIIKDNGNNR